MYVCLKYDGVSRNAGVVMLKKTSRVIKEKLFNGG